MTKKTEQTSVSFNQELPLQYEEQRKRTHEKIKILILEDNDNDVGLIEYYLRKGGIDFVAEKTVTKDEYVKAIKSFRPDVILADHALPSFSGPEAYRIRNELAVHTPFLYVSGRIDEELYIECIRNGVTNYVFKDKLFTLSVKVERAIKEAKEREQKHNLLLNLEQSERRLARAQRVAQIGSWETDLSNFHVAWSEETYRIFEIDHKDFNNTYSGFLSYVHPEDCARVDDSFINSLKATPTSVIEHRIITGTGIVKYVEERWQVFYNNNGEPVSAVGTCQDISERIKAQEQIKNSEAKLKEAQALARISNWDIDLTTNVHTWSDEFYNIFGLKKDEVTPSAEAFVDLLHPEDRPYAQSRIDEAFKTLHSSSFEFRFLSKDGALHYGYTDWKIGFDKNHKPIRMYGILQDFTERKIAELERQKITTDLVARNKDLEQFAFIVSHNLRAPVANIIGATNALVNASELSVEEQLELNTGLLKSVLRLDDVVKDLNDILNVKRAINERKEKVRFSALVEDIKDSIARLIDAHKVQINCSFHVDEMVTIKSYLYSIFYNLISNSIKYRRIDTPCIIQISCIKQNDRLKILFSDNGRGIDMNSRGEHVFGLYKRFHPDVEGKGVGLYMVKTQVETLGGKITVESEVNKGATFKMEFEQ